MREGEEVEKFVEAEGGSPVEFADVRREGEEAENFAEAEGGSPVEFVSDAAFLLF